MGVRGLGNEAIYNIFRYSILIGYWGILDLRPKHIKIKRNPESDCEGRFLALPSEEVKG